jgi:hypothetical protein
VIRIPKGDYKTDLGYLYGQFIRDIKKGKTKAIAIKIGESTFQLIGTKNRNPENADDDLLIVMTNLPNKKHKIIAIYGLRWQIESMFKCLKSNGFNLEELGFTNPNKVRLMLCIVIACYVLCICEGIKQMKAKAKKTKNGVKKNRVSLFHQGFEIVNRKVQKIALFLDWLLNTVFCQSKKNKPIFN